MLASRLDAIDTARTILSELSGDRAFARELFNVIPQFAVIGNQSAGKSSVLRRISGVTLPEAAKRCTRLPILLMLRREATAAEPQVRLMGPGIKPDYGRVAVLNGDVTAAIKQAQDRAVELSGSEFASAFRIEVLVRRPNVPNVTLVDLPGFFDPKEHEVQDAEAVSRMAESFMELDGTLLLHVVGGDQDYGSVLKKRDIEKASAVPSKVTMVLTKLDLLETQGKTKALESFAALLDQVTVPCFALDGAVARNEDESMQNLCVHGNSRVRGWGREPLNVYLEQHIYRHLEAQLPTAVRLITAQLRDARVHLEKFKMRDASEVLSLTRDAIQRSLDARAGELETRIRIECFEALAREIGLLKLRPLSGEPADPPVLRAATLDELRVGDQVWVVQESDDDDDPACPFGPCLLNALNGDEAVLSHEPTVPVSRLLVRDGVSLEDDIIRIIRRQSGLRNTPYTDLQVPLEMFMSDFAQRYGAVLREKMAHVAQLVRAAHLAAFASADIPVAGQPVARRMQNQLERTFELLAADTEGAIERIEAWNKLPLVCTTNTHYLYQNFQWATKDCDNRVKTALSCLGGKVPNMQAATMALNAAPKQPTDESILDDFAKNARANIEAFWKVQVKAVAEAGAKECGRIYLVEARREYGQISLQARVEWVEEPHEHAFQRQVWDQRVDVLRRALNALQT